MNENKKTGYDTAIKLTDKTSRTIWSVYTALLASNAFLLSFAAFLIPNLNQSDIFIKLISLLGIIICISWFLITMRNFDYYHYYFRFARKYEEEAFGDEVTMIRDGDSFARGNEITTIDPKIRLRWGSRLFKVQWMVYAVIFSFLTIYIFLLFFLK